MVVFQGEFDKITRERGYATRMVFVIIGTGKLQIHRQNEGRI